MAPHIGSTWVKHGDNEVIKVMFVWDGKDVEIASGVHIHSNFKRMPIDVFLRDYYQVKQVTRWERA